MPRVQPMAAAMLARHLRVRPVVMVYTTPVPGIRTTTSEARRNSGVIMICLHSKVCLSVRLNHETQNHYRDCLNHPGQSLLDGSVKGAQPEVISLRTIVITCFLRPFARKYFK